MVTIDPGSVETPCYVCDLAALDHNLEVLADVRDRAGCRVLLALKGFAMWSVFPRIGKYLDGVCASSLFEARLGREELGKEVHVYSPAFAPAEIPTIAELADHVIFNSLTQLETLAPLARTTHPDIGVGLRINPEHSEVDVALYDPCAPGSRLGVTNERLDRQRLDGVDGLHFHTLCEQGADALMRTLARVESVFGDVIPRVQWVNMGGGHHITRADYDVDALVDLIVEFRKRHGVDVIIEPGEAVALDTGVLVTSVLDIVHNEVPTAILDTSVAAHMPDVLEMPYRPNVLGAEAPGTLEHTYRLGGLTCLAGDVLGDYSFAQALRPGQRLVLLDMAHYTMVKNTTFNGVRLPSIATYDPRTGETRVVRSFGYPDYRDRLS